MTKEEFITRRTVIISEMLDSPDEYGIYPTTKCFEELDALYDEISSEKEKPIRTNEGYQPKYLLDISNPPTELGTGASDLWTSNDMIDFATLVYNRIADLPGHEPDIEELKLWSTTKN